MGKQRSQESTQPGHTQQGSEGILSLVGNTLTASVSPTLNQLGCPRPQSCQAAAVGTGPSEGLSVLVSVESGIPRPIQDR